MSLLSMFSEGAGGSGVVPLKAPTNFETFAQSNKVSLSWTDPEDETSQPSGVAVSVWDYTRIIRKVGSQPTSPYDGVLIVESSIRNQYQSEPFVDTTVENGTVYYYAAFAYNENSVVSEGAFATASPKSVAIYGVEWNGTDTTKWTRILTSKDFPDPEPAVNNGTGSSPFDDLLPWSGMVKSEHPEAGTVVAIPKFWYKWTELNPGLRLEIADGPAEGFYVSPAHCDRGDGAGERDIVYVGRYKCGGVRYQSLSDRVPEFTYRERYREQIQALLGKEVWQWDWAMNWAIKMLYLVEFADWNSQANIGEGGRPGNFSISYFRTGQTDPMAYHTGTTGQKRTDGSCCQYRNIEGLWDNVYDFIDGCYCTASGFKIILNPNDFSEIAKGEILSLIPESGWPSAYEVVTAMNNQWIWPTELNGSATSYTTDYFRLEPTLEDVAVGGSYNTDDLMGLFQIRSYEDRYVGDDVGSRLMVLPNPEVTA